MPRQKRTIRHKSQAKDGQISGGHSYPTRSEWHALFGDAKNDMKQTIREENGKLRKEIIQQNATLKKLKNEMNERFEKVDGQIITLKRDLFDSHEYTMTRIDTLEQNMENVIQKKVVVCMNARMDELEANLMGMVDKRADVRVADHREKDLSMLNRHDEELVIAGEQIRRNTDRSKKNEKEIGRIEKRVVVLEMK